MTANQNLYSYIKFFVPFIEPANHVIMCFRPIPCMNIHGHSMELFEWVDGP